MKEITACVILSGHTIPTYDLIYRGDKGTILCGGEMCKSVDRLQGNRDMDGNYSVYDKKRGVFIRICMTVAEIIRR